MLKGGGYLCSDREIASAQHIVVSLLDGLDKFSMSFNSLIQRILVAIYGNAKQFENQKKNNHNKDFGDE